MATSTEFLHCGLTKCLAHLVCAAVQFSVTYVLEQFCGMAGVWVCCCKDGQSLQVICFLGEFPWVPFWN